MYHTDDKHIEVGQQSTIGKKKRGGGGKEKHQKSLLKLLGTQTKPANADKRNQRYTT